VKEDETNNRSLVLPSIDSESYPTVNPFPNVISVVYASFGSSDFLNIFIYHSYHSEATRGDSSAFGVFTAASHGTNEVMIIMCHPF